MRFALRSRKRGGMNNVVSTTSEAQIIAAYKARRRRLGMEGPRLLAGRRSEPGRQLDDLRPYQARLIAEVPSWIREPAQFDSHVIAMRLWHARAISRCRDYVRRRCAELGISFKNDIMPDIRLRETVRIRDSLVYEIKTFIKPDAKWNDIGRIFNRDHSSIISMYNRGAMRAGDPVAAAKVVHRRIEGARRSAEAKAKVKRG